MAELFAQIAVMADVAIEPQYEPERQGEMRRLSLNSSRAEQILEWKPQVGLTEGLGSVLAHFKEN